MKKKLMIDMDNVITTGTFQKQIEDFLGHPISLETTGYYLQDALKSRKEEFFQKGPLDMYQDAPLMENAYEVIEKLNQTHDLYMISAYQIKDAPYQEGNHLKAKMDYLQKKLPFLDTSQLIFINQKNLVQTDIIIDDSIENLKCGKMKILYDAHHNQSLNPEQLKKENIIRVKNWQEIKKLLL